jgi:chemotaxis protein MotB
MENTEHTLAPEVAESSAEPFVPPVIERPPESKCPECPKGVPFYLATFSDMAILLMAFFVLILAQVQFDIQNFQKISGSLRQSFGVQTMNLEIKPPTARSLLVETFSPADTVRDLSDNLRQLALNTDSQYLLRNTDSFDNKYDIQRELEILRAVFEEEITQGEVSVRIDGETFVVEINSDASSPDTNGGQSQRRSGTVRQEVIDAIETVAQVQSEIIREISVFAVSNSQAAAAEAAERERIAGERLEQVRTQLQTQQQRGLLEIEREQDEVIIRLASQDSFRSGSADLTQGFSELLEEVARTIDLADAQEVRVEGHSDNLPIAFSDVFRSNWDLSSARASAVTNLLLEDPALADIQFSVVGFADTVPIASNETPEGRAQNRRIDIKLAEFSAN